MPFFIFHILPIFSPYLLHTEPISRMEHLCFNENVSCGAQIKAFPKAKGKPEIEVRQ